MKKYTVKQLADLAGISVRTLHHYDQIGLLRPHKRSQTNYRYYGQLERLQLQQILFYRELDYPLEKIQEVLTDPKFDLSSSLTFQRKELEKKAERLKKLLNTVDKTLYNLNHKTMITDDELYAGFKSVEEGKALTKEAEERWGQDEVQKSHDRIKKMSPAQWKAIQDEGGALGQKFADLMGTHQADSEEVQRTVVLFHRHMENFYPVGDARLRGLGQLYVTDDRFRAFYDKFKLGLADFINKAIQIYCDRGMKV